MEDKLEFSFVKLVEAVAKTIVLIKEKELGEAFE